MGDLLGRRKARKRDIAFDNVSGGVLESTCLMSRGRMTGSDTNPFEGSAEGDPILDGETGSRSASTPRVLDCGEGRLSAEPLDERARV